MVTSIKLNYLELDSVGSVICQAENQKIFVYPYDKNGSYDCDCPLEINELSDRWWRSLSDYDFLLIADNINLRPYIQNDSFANTIDKVKFNKGYAVLETN